MKHSGSGYRRNYAGFRYIGENLYWEYASTRVNPDENSGKKAVDTWYAEIADFQYSPRGVVCPKRGRKEAIGHFTQVMWDKSVDLGCGYATCGDSTSVVIVCQYGPGGNYNQHKNPPFPPEAAQRLNQSPVNKQFGGLPSCRQRPELDVDKIRRDVMRDLPRPSR